MRVRKIQHVKTAEAAGTSVTQVMAWADIKHYNTCKAGKMLDPTGTGLYSSGRAGGSVCNVNIILTQSFLFHGKRAAVVMETMAVKTSTYRIAGDHGIHSHEIRSEFLCFLTENRDVKVDYI